MVLPLKNAVVGAICTCAAAALPAQHVRGLVSASDGKPAAGIVVVATTADMKTTVRGLTNASGTYDLTLPSAGTVTVSALRLGFRPTVAAGVAVPASGAVDLPITLGNDPVALSAVTVRSADVCGRAAEGEVVRAWTEARTALAAATLWSREPMDAEWITYDRRLRGMPEQVKQQTVRTARSGTLHAFKSLTPEILAEKGYVFEEGGGASYNAPDAEVLVSDAFADTHCFHLEPEVAAHPGAIGVGFRPQRTRNVVDIEGTLWIDRATAELRTLEFRYTGMPSPANEVNPGGQVEFMRLAEGPWMVSRWFIRMPDIGPPERDEKGYQRTMLKESASVLRGVGVSGGMVGRLRRRGEVLYIAPGATLELQLASSDPAVSLGGATVTLSGTDYEWRTDAAGHLKVQPVLDGSYTARVQTPMMQWFGVDPVEAPVVVGAKAGVTRVELPPGKDLVKASCGADAVRSGTGILYGTVKDSTGRASAGRAITAIYNASLATVSGGRVIAGKTTVGVLTDDAGRFKLCDLPRGKSVLLRSSGDDGDATLEATIPDTSWMASVALKVSGASTAIVDSTTATLELSVRDRAGALLPDASLELTAPTGETKKVTTDAKGRAMVAAFPPGLAKVRAKRVGYAPGDLVVTVAGGRNTLPFILDKNSLPVLDTVRVIGSKKRSAEGYDGFETRRMRKEATASFTAEEIAKRNATEISDLLRGVASVRVTDSLGVQVATLSRGFKLDKDANAQPCTMRVLLDGMRMPDAAGVNVVRAAEVRGLEVFGSTGRVPATLASSPTEAACGVIAIWTARSP